MGSVDGLGQRKKKSIRQTILALGWSYVLSARLVEVQEEGAYVIYTDSEGTGYGHGSGHEHSLGVTIEIGEVGEDVAQWWAAVLAPNQGWKAVVSQRENGEYLAPWSVSRAGTHCIDIKWQPDASASKDFIASRPPSSRKAFKFLA